MAVWGRVVKIRWIKVAPGVYQTDSGRFRAEKRELFWYVYDLNVSDREAILYGDSYREARMLVDDQIDYEESANV